MKKIEVEIPWDIGDTVYLMYGNLVRKAVIKEVVVRLSQISKHSIRYKFGIYYIDKQEIETIHETVDWKERTFATKDQAIYSWLKKNNVNPRETMRDYFQVMKENGEY